MPKDKQLHRKRTTNQNGEYLWGESAVGGVSCACLSVELSLLTVFVRFRGAYLHFHPQYLLTNFAAAIIVTQPLYLSLSLVACYHPYHLHCQHTKSPTGIHQVVETAVDRREIVSYPTSTTTITDTTIVLVETHSSSNPNQRRRRPDTKTILLGRAENVTYCQTSAVRCRSLVKTAKST